MADPEQSSESQISRSSRLAKLSRRRMTRVLTAGREYFEESREESNVTESGDPVSELYLRNAAQRHPEGCECPRARCLSKLRVRLPAQIDDKCNVDHDMEREDAEDGLVQEQGEQGEQSPDASPRINDDMPDVSDSIDRATDIATTTGGRKRKRDEGGEDDSIPTTSYPHKCRAVDHRPPSRLDVACRDVLHLLHLGCERAKFPRDAASPYALSLYAVRNLDCIQRLLHGNNPTPAQLDNVGIMLALEQKTGGGILADDMGLGKTLQILLLILQTRAEGRTTLIIVPAMVRTLWKNSLEQLPLRWAEWRRIKHGLMSATLNVHGYDVVLATHGDIEYAVRPLLKRMEDRRLRHRGQLYTEPRVAKGRVKQVGRPLVPELVDAALITVKFFRIVVDEGHVVKNKFANTGRALHGLKADFRWAVTGTPMINDYEEFQGILRFLHLKPLDDESTWRLLFTHEVQRPEVRGVGPQDTGFVYQVLDGDQGLMVRLIRQGITVRKQRKDTFEGVELVSIPPHVEHWVRVNLFQAERDAQEETREIWDPYERQILDDAPPGEKRKLSRFPNRTEKCRAIVRGKATVNTVNTWTVEGEVLGQDMETIMEKDRDEGLNIIEDLDDREDVGGEDFDDISDSDGDTTEAFETPRLMTTRDHGFGQSRPRNRTELCQQLALDQHAWRTAKTTTAVEITRTRLQMRKLEARRMREVAEANGQDGYEQERRWLMRHKVLIFSAYIAPLEMVKDGLRRHEIRAEVFDGASSESRRSELVEAFEGRSTLDGQNLQVLLVSSRAGGVGLTLLAATDMVIMDTEWSEAIRAQAISRALRIGQEYEVMIFNIYCWDSIEREILVKRRFKTEKINGVMKNQELDDIRNVAVEKLEPGYWTEERVKSKVMQAQEAPRSRLPRL